MLLNIRKPNVYVQLTNSAKKKKRKTQNQHAKLNENKSRAYQNLCDVGKGAL